MTDTMCFTYYDRTGDLPVGLRGQHLGGFGTGKAPTGSL